MKDRAVRRYIWMAALLTLAAGFLLTVQTLRQISEANVAVRGKRKQWAELQRLDEERDSYSSALSAYGRIPGRRAVMLETVLSGALSGVEAEDTRENIRELADGWTLRRKEVILGDIPLTGIMTAIRQAEAQRPPWRLAECVISASPLTPGHGRVVLTFEVLEHGS